MTFDDALARVRATRKSLFECSQQRMKLVAHKDAGVVVADAQFTAINAQIEAARKDLLDAREMLRVALLSDTGAEAP